MRSAIVLMSVSLSMLLHAEVVSASERTTRLRVALVLVPGCLVRELDLTATTPGESIVTVPLDGMARGDGMNRLRVDCSRGAGDFAVTAEARRALAAPVAVDAAVREANGDRNDHASTGRGIRRRPARLERVDDDAIRLTILW